MKVLKDRPYYQQGDVIIEPIDDIPRETLTQDPLRVLAHGESGNTHIAANPAVTMLMANELLKYMTVPKEGTTITHEEHGHIDVPSGKYRIRRVQEFDYWANEARAVAD